MSTSLIEKLDSLTDARRAEGKRHKISTVVIIAILAMIAQIYSLRGFELFAKRHHDLLVKYLKIEKNRLPSFYVFRTVLPKINFDELADVIKEWILSNNLLKPKDWYSIDGKSIRSTMDNYNSNDQNFASVVTAFAHTSGIALLSAKFENKKISEIAIAEALIKSINCQDQTFTLDALHCKKNS